jgi:excisionase family DNA binding protein
VSPVQQLEKGTYSIAEAAVRLGVSARTARRLRLEGKFPVRVLKIGGRWKVLAAELERFLDGQVVA